MTHTATNRDKPARINIYCPAPEQLRLLNGRDNKCYMSCKCLGGGVVKWSGITLGLCHMVALSPAVGEFWCHMSLDSFLTRPRVVIAFIMQIAINGCTKLRGERKKKKGVIIPVESSWHHIVVNKLPLPPKVHWTVQLQDKIRMISVTLFGEEDIANKHQSNHYVTWKLHWKKKKLSSFIFPLICSWELIREKLPCCRDCTPVSSSPARGGRAGSGYGS